MVSGQQGIDVSIIITWAVAWTDTKTLIIACFEMENNADRGDQIHVVGRTTVPQKRCECVCVWWWVCCQRVRYHLVLSVWEAFSIIMNMNMMMMMMMMAGEIEISGQCTRLYS